MGWFICSTVNLYITFNLKIIFFSQNVGSLPWNIRNWLKYKKRYSGSNYEIFIQANFYYYILCYSKRSPYFFFFFYEPTSYIKSTLYYKKSVKNIYEILSSFFWRLYYNILWWWHSLIFVILQWSTSINGSVSQRHVSYQFDPSECLIAESLDPYKINQTS